jgi:hypothetical protein
LPRLAGERLAKATEGKPALAARLLGIAVTRRQPKSSYQASNTVRIKMRLDDAIKSSMPQMQSGANNINRLAFVKRQTPPPGCPQTASAKRSK